MAQVPVLRGDRDFVEKPANAGYYQLHWNLPGTGEDTPPKHEARPEFELVESAHDDFADSRSIYRGIDVATTISGRPDGTYHYRVRIAGGPWSKTVTVKVEHHPLAHALIYLVIGAGVFLATLAVVIVGHRQHRDQAGGE